MGRTVELLWHEVLMAATIGVARHLSAMRGNRPDLHGAQSAENGWQLHIEGACGEMATAKALGMHWSGSVDTFKVGGDVGSLQVRTRSNPLFDLVIRDSDRETDVFVLVTGSCPVYGVHGWFQPIRPLKDSWRKEYGNREAAYFIPRSKLRPLDELKAHLAGQVA
jgi:hypothetical protein